MPNPERIIWTAASGRFGGAKPGAACRVASAATGPGYP